jgi:hypothetical protein
MSEMAGSPSQAQSIRVATRALEVGLPLLFVALAWNNSHCGASWHRCVPADPAAAR